MLDKINQILSQLREDWKNAKDQETKNSIEIRAMRIKHARDILEEWKKVHKELKDDGILIEKNTRR